jgi:hypothetical protein
MEAAGSRCKSGMDPRRSNTAPFKVLRISLREVQVYIFSLVVKEKLHNYPHLTYN